VHTLKVIGVGFLTLGVFLIAGRVLGGPSDLALGTAARFFIPVWLVVAAVNLYIGVTRAGYSIGDEAPVFLVVFAVPAAAALFLWWRFQGR